MKRCFANKKTKTCSDYTGNVKNVEMMKSSKSSKNPTSNYKLKGNVFESFSNYETFLSLVKAYTDMRFVICDECKCKSRPPSSIVEGTSSYKCEDLVSNNCQKCLYPYGRFVNQDIVEQDECFQFPRRITNDPCIRPDPCITEPCIEEHPVIPVITPCKPVFKGMQPCCRIQTAPKCFQAKCKPNIVTQCNYYNSSMKPCCFKQTKICGVEIVPDPVPVPVYKPECGNPILKCATPCRSCLCK